MSGIIGNTVNTPTPDKVLIVTAKDGVASHNAIQIVEYAEKGYAVYLAPFDDLEKYSLVRLFVESDYAFAEFSFSSAEEAILYAWRVYSDGSIEILETNVISRNDFDYVIGNVEAALDAIIEIQNGLIGGNV